MMNAQCTLLHYTGEIGI